MSDFKTSELPENLKKSHYYLPKCFHDECFTSIFLKHESFTVGDLDEVFEEMVLMRTVFNLSNKNKKEIIKGPLSFVVGDV